MLEDRRASRKHYARESSRTDARRGRIRLARDRAPQVKEKGVKLTFKDGKVSGSGENDFGEFSIKGTYTVSGDTGRLEARKKYLYADRDSGDEDEIEDAPIEDAGARVASEARGRFRRKRSLDARRGIRLVRERAVSNTSRIRWTRRSATSRTTPRSPSRSCGRAWRPSRRRSGRRRRRGWSEGVRPVT